jgi:transcription factor C subunit 3
MSSSSESQYSSNDDLSEVEDWSDSGMEVEQKDQFVHLKVSAPTARRKSITQTRMLNPAVEFYPTNGTFSTDPILKGVPQTRQGTRSVAVQSEQPNTAAVPAPKTFEFVFETTPWLGRKGLSSTEICINAGTLDPAITKGQTQQRAGKRKRVRFAEASIDDDEEEQSQRRPKRQRFMLDEYQDNDSSLSDSDEESNHTRRRSRKRRTKKGKSSQKGRKPYPEPTLTERLSGLTGNPDDPIYFMPRKKKGFNRWRVDPTLQKDPKPRRVVRESDPSEHFPRLCFTLAIAHCMSGDEGNVEWDIVETVYRSEPSFSLPNTKSLWRWMQINMAQEVQTLTNDFQTAFLDAYAAGKVDSIDDPKTYDWAALVRWAMRTFEHPQARLPETKEELGDYYVEDSQYLQFDAVDWNIQSYSYVNRAQRALKYAYASPIHTKPARASSDDISRARSWVRSNTATLQEHYSGTQAHSKFKQLDTPLLERVVNEMVEKKILRMRKIKRLLPGRNFDFTATLAMKYRRMFELDVFTQAASLKASLDSAFANENPSKRAFTLSRTAPDGAVMAILSLLNEGRIKLIPKLPPVDNGLRAPAPRLSVWGFQPCQYSSRAIPREQLFWRVDAVPTATYRFGNPLDPSPSPLHQNVRAPPSPEPEWKDLSTPPLPGKMDANTLLPIWSSFDGKEVTWPWWYRILNLVMQALIFQPGATAPEIHRHCTSIATELFEVELVLNWLVDVGAAKASHHVNAMGEVRTAYETLPAFYAVFGRELKGQDKEDWFGEKVKRNKTNEIQIRGKAPSAYNLRFRRVGALLRGETVGDAVSEESPQATHAEEEVEAHVDGDTAMADADAVVPTVAPTGLDGTHDTDMDADGEWDVDAEGEVDDEMLDAMSPVTST